MTPKIEKIAGEIRKTRARIAQDEARVKELEELKLELENEEIISRVRASEVPLKEIGTFLRAYRETGLPPPAVDGAEDAPQAASTSRATRPSRSDRATTVRAQEDGQEGDVNE